MNRLNKHDRVTEMLRMVTNFVGRNKNIPQSTAVITGILYAVVNEMDSDYGPNILKVKRTEDAKQFPLIHAKKNGDVGYDLPAIMPYKQEYIGLPESRKLYVDYWSAEGVPREEMERNMRESIWINPARVSIQPGDCDEIPGRATIPTGIRLELPEGYWASIEARSSTSKMLLTVPKGIIDEGYRGELFAVILNFGNEPIEVKHGDRLVQLIIHKRRNADIVIEEVDELSKSDRGSDGFGSTGKSG